MSETGIDEELFDFDLPVTPVTASDKSSSDSPSTQEDEDEVFFGPVKYRERIAASTVVRSAKKENASLNDRQWAELHKEANRVVKRMSKAVDNAGDNTVHTIVQKLFDFGSPRTRSTTKNKENLGNLEAVPINFPDCDKLYSVGKPLCDITSNLSDCVIGEQKKSNTPDKDSINKKTSGEIIETGTTDSDSLDKVTKTICKNIETTTDSLKKGNCTDKDSGLKKAATLGSTEKQINRRSVGKLQFKKQSQLKVPNQVVLKKSPVEWEAAKAPKSRLPCMKLSGIPASSNGSGSTSKLQKPSGLARPALTKSAGKTGQTKQDTEGVPVRTAPTSKLQLKPSGLKRPSGLTKPADNLKKNGPMKAFAPVAGPPEEEDITPAKVQKSVNRKNLSASFCTPSKSGSASSMDSPASGMRRRSGLPTPSKSRTSSAGCLPSPRPRGSSSSSTKSMESPLVKLNSSISKRRPSTVTKHSERPGSISDINDKSPSAMLAKRNLVVNTPNLPKKRISPWSPVERKRACDPLEEATRCTKKRMN